MERVYFFRQKGTNYVKIGMTRGDVKVRFSSFCTYSPTGGEIIGSIACDDSFKLEKEIHKKLKSKRLKGEFFNLSKEECDEIILSYQVNNIDLVLRQVSLYVGNDPDRGKEVISAIEKLKNKKIISTDYVDELSPLIIHEGVKEWNSINQLLDLLCDEHEFEVSAVSLGMRLSRMGVRKRRIRKGEDVRVYYNCSVLPRSTLKNKG